LLICSNIFAKNIQYPKTKADFINKMREEIEDKKNKGLLQNFEIKQNVSIVSRIDQILNSCEIFDNFDLSENSEIVFKQNKNKSITSGFNKQTNRFYYTKNDGIEREFNASDKTISEKIKTKAQKIVEEISDSDFRITGEITDWRQDKNKSKVIIKKGFAFRRFIDGIMVLDDVSFVEVMFSSDEKPSSILLSDPKFLKKDDIISVDYEKVAQKIEKKVDKLKIPGSLNPTKDVKVKKHYLCFRTENPSSNFNERGLLTPVIGIDIELIDEGKYTYEQVISIPAID